MPPDPTGVPLIDRALAHGQRIAITDGTGEHSYAILGERSAARAKVLLGDRADLSDARIAFMLPPGAGYVAVQWAIWRAGGIAVPLCPDHPPPELAWALRDSGAEAVVCAPGYADRLRPALEGGGAELLIEESEGPAVPPMVETPGADLPRLDPDRRAMILFTSGTTSRPKGVVYTHEMIRAQVECLVGAWEWTETDRILHVLPLHHTHGIVNALACPLWVGATCRMQDGFEADRVWESFTRGEVSLFMAVPTAYVKLIEAWEAAGSTTRRRWSEGASTLRLMVSGSAALPASVFARWEEITGHRLLERYGMTEIGMGLSNPLRGERRPATVGQPLPGVEVRLVDEAGHPVAAENEAGEIQVRGPGVFREYWEQPDVTAAAFDGGWFRTGDIGRIEDGYFRILGRRSVDILKTGGYKVSALEIEDTLRTHPQVRDCAVVGIADEAWGQRVSVALVATSAVSPETLEAWMRERVAPYKVPRAWLIVPDLPRNAMGKVRKDAVGALFARES